MADQEPVVIVDKDGHEHEFPPGFDPKRAAAIVRVQSYRSSPESQEATARAIANASGSLIPPRKQYSFDPDLVARGNEKPVEVGGPTGLTKILLTGAAKNPALEGMAHPSGLMDLAGLVVPGGPGAGGPLPLGTQQLLSWLKPVMRLGGAAAGGYTGYSLAPQDSTVKKVLYGLSGAALGGAAQNAPDILEHLPGRTGEALAPVIEKYRNWNSPFTATGRENRALLGSPFGDANAYRRDLYFRGINPEGPPAPSPAPTITPNPAGPTVFDEAAAQAKTEAATKDATDYARAQAHMDIGGPRPAAQAPTITRINPPPGPFEQVAAQAQDEKAAQDLAAYNRAQAHMDIGQPRMAGSHDVAPADITDTATDYYDVSKQNKQQKMAQQKAQQARQATVSQMATEPAPAATTPEITPEIFAKQNGVSVAKAQQMIAQMQQAGTIPTGEIPFTPTTTLGTAPKAPLTVEDLPDAWKALDTSAGTGPVTAVTPEHPLASTRRAIGADDIAKVTGQKADAIRAATGVQGAEQPGKPQLVFPDEDAERIFNEVKELPRFGPERDAYLAKSENNPKAWAQIQSYIRALKYSGLAVPAALASRLSLLGGMTSTPDMPTPPPPPPGFSQ